MKKTIKIFNVLKKSLVIILLILLYLSKAYVNICLTDNEVPNTETINLNTIPEFSNSAYVELNNNVPNFTEKDYTTKPFEIYSELDNSGRCGVAYANICIELMPSGPRENISNVKPTGWKNKTYPKLIDGGYLYNRCHLIGYQLAEENANKKNLITGTRYFNVTGMLPFEDMVDDYIEKNEKNHVLYRVTPIYKGDNLVAHGVQMEAYSVEDNGKGARFYVLIYNIQPGITIDYSTGDSCERN